MVYTTCVLSITQQYMTTLTLKDRVYLNDLIKAIESTLGEYDETWYDQIDLLRGKIAEFSDMVNDELYGENEPTYQDIRDEALQSEVYDHLEAEYQYNNLQSL